MEEPSGCLGGFVLPPPPLVSFTPTVHSRRRRLSSSSYFTQAARQPLASSRTFAWLSLQGRLVNAEEASSLKSIGRGSLGNDEALAWELFTPIQRFLIVAVIGVAASESKKNRTISQLQKSVQLRDEVLSSMQEKLDNLCEQMVSIKGQGTKNNDDAEEKSKSSLCSGEFGCENIKFVDCGCWHCDQHYQELFGGSMGKVCGEVDETMEFKRANQEEEQEERRMSDLSDWASSSVSASEFQVANYAVDQDVCNLKKICEEKDATIKELTDVLQLTDNAGSKRVAELEDIISRKSAVITRLKKDMLVLEHKVVQLTRLRRKSSSNATALEFEQAPPMMLDNIIYDMDSLTSSTSSSSSSSDSDSPQLRRNSLPATMMKQITRPVSPLKEISSNQKFSRTKQQLSANGDIKKMRRRPQAASSSSLVPKKRWS
ncbi:hypothetical protein LINGRAHAP2_LOCUS21777 [Linum grandiflorum]